MADFPEGVTVTVPKQKHKGKTGKDKKPKVNQLPFGSLDNMKPKQSTFKPGRPVINFVVVDENDGDALLTEFDPKLEFQVKYAKADQDRATAAGKSLQLAFWDGNDWVILTAAKHGFALHADSNPNKGGYASVSISRWADPPLAWGP
jgi:hypothetical protein